MATHPPSDPSDRGAREGAGGPDPADGEGRRSARLEAVRRAVDQAVTATAGAPRSTRARAQDLADELTAVAGRVRTAFEDLGAAGSSQAGALADDLQGVVGRLGRTIDDARPASADELRRVSERLDAVEARLARLEGVEPASGHGPRSGS